ncbi:hypothetical protein BH09PLA1_BH09PLA1_09910 [soil metagenome]
MRLKSLRAAVRPAIAEILESRTFLAAQLAGPVRPAVRPPAPGTEPLGITLGQWHTYAQATADLQSFVASYPTLARLISIGKTVQNRDIWALEISDNVGVDEDEPEFYYQGAIHGDEPVGMENSFYLINDLLTGYGTNSRYTNLVNNMDLWFVPNINWDGYTLSSPTTSRRGNANNIDLNRNFPEWTTRSFSSNTRYLGAYGNMFDGPAPQTTLLQPETVAVMNFLQQHNFVASAVFHGGDLVVNYPWDTDSSSGANYAVHPNDALYKAMALVYSTPNAPMYANNSSPFVHGTTNGDNWYPISGGEQDWATIYTGSNQFTIELGYTKYPTATNLPTLWNNNRESMLQFMEAGNWGLRGVVTNANTGAPLFAKVTLVSPAPSPTPDTNHPATSPVFTDPDIGDYHRQLLPGTYTLKFEAPGFQTQTISGVQITGNTNDPTLTRRLTVALLPIDNVAPTVQSAGFRFDASPQSLRFTFSEPVQNLDNSDLLLQNLSTGAMVPATSINLANYDATTYTATFTFNTPGNTLPGGSYTASLNSAGVQDLSNNPLASGFNYNFLYAAGTAGNDAIYAVQGNASLLVWVNADPQTASPTYSAVFSSLNNFSVDANGGDDSLTLDSSAGDVRPAGASGFGYRLGANNETLRLRGPVAWNFATDPSGATPLLTLTLESNASATFSAVATHLAALNLSTTSSASLAAGSARRLSVGGLTIDNTSSLDLNDNGLMIKYTGASPLSSTQLRISGGAIRSSTAQANPLHNTTLGAMDSSDYESIYGPGASFAGEPISGSAVLVKYTYFGDADFNGVVNFDDYSRIDTGFSTGRSGWLNGDFDGNGIVNFDDYSLIDLAFNTQGSGL